MAEMKERATCYNCLFIDIPMGDRPVCVYDKFVNDGKPRKLIHDIKKRRYGKCPLREQGIPIERAEQPKLIVYKIGRAHV